MTDAGPRTPVAPKRPRRRPIAVASASLASFLAVLTLLSAQLHAGHDPALGQAVASSAQHGGSQVVTRTSGGGATAAHGATAKHTGHATVTTRTSGGGGEGGEDD
jgi:hypothetical protein